MASTPEARFIRAYVEDSNFLTIPGRSGLKVGEILQLLQDDDIVRQALVSKVMAAGVLIVGRIIDRAMSISLDPNTDPKTAIEAMRFVSEVTGLLPAKKIPRRRSKTKKALDTLTTGLPKPEGEAPPAKKRGRPRRNPPAEAGSGPARPSTLEQALAIMAEGSNQGED